MMTLGIHNTFDYGVTAMAAKDVNMLSGSIMKGLLGICIPIMIMNVLQSMFNIVDMTVLKAFDTDGMAVGAVGVCGTLITLISNLVIGIATGSNVIVAKYVGKKDPYHVDRAAGTSIAFPCVAGLVLAAIGISCAEIFLGWVNCPKELFSRAVLYFRLYFAGIPVLLTYNFSVNVLRATGNSRRIMMISITGGIVKVAGTLLLVAVFRLGIVGVALATILSWIVYAGLGLFSLLRSKGAVKLYIRHIRFYSPELPRSCGSVFLPVCK